jgi:Spore germination protein.
MQRMESLLITIWIVKILAIVSLGLWAACHSMKQNIRLKQRLSLKVFIGLILILLLFIKNDDQIQMVTRLYSTIGQYIVFCYIPILFGISIFLKNNAVQNN